PAGRHRLPGVVTMQERHNPELQIGDGVRVHAPRTRWDQRHETLHRIEVGQRSYAWVILGGTATRFPLRQLSGL
ncbi:hypothetical protein, partial [Cyanobium sp. BA20m-p-22]|uniref:hypothetical protein n=1 Tax=Cyanobium sp. BA20m-p-22 TaxID=2823704 RepID=UPI0020CCFD82